MQERKYERWGEIESPLSANYVCKYKEFDSFLGDLHRNIYKDKKGKEEEEKEEAYVGETAGRALV